MSKAEEVFERIEALTASGMTKADAFKQLSQELDIKVNSVRGAYYQGRPGQEGQSRRPRRRETTPEDAVADARAAFKRALASVDREVETAAERLKEAQAEYEALQASAEERKQAITAKLEALS